MKGLTFFILASLAFLMSFGQESQPAPELSKLTDRQKAAYYDNLSSQIDNAPALRIFRDSGYIRLRKLPAASAFLKMTEFFRHEVFVLDSADVRKGRVNHVYTINLSDSIFFRNTYYYKEGQIVKIKNVTSVPHLVNEAVIYYANGTPFKIFWAFTKDPYVAVFDFYYFDGESISDNGSEDLRAYSPFEYQRAIQLFRESKHGN